MIIFIFALLAHPGGVLRFIDNSNPTGTYFFIDLVMGNGFTDHTFKPFAFKRSLNRESSACKEGGYIP